MRGSRNNFINTSDAGVAITGTFPNTVVKTGTISGLNGGVRVTGIGTLFYKQSPADTAGRTSDIPGEVEEGGYLQITSTGELRKIKSIYNPLILDVEVPFTSDFAAQSVKYIPPHNKYTKLCIKNVGGGSGNIIGSDGIKSTLEPGDERILINGSNSANGIEPIGYDATGTNFEIQTNY